MSGTAQRFALRKNIVGSKFFDDFAWETMDDPTHGRVNYVGMKMARALNLSYGTSLLFMIVLCSI